MQEKQYVIVDEEEYEDLEEERFVLDDDDVDVEIIMAEENTSSPENKPSIKITLPKQNKTEDELEEELEEEELLRSIDEDFGIHRDDEKVALDDDDLDPDLQKEIDELPEEKKEPEKKKSLYEIEELQEQPEYYYKYNNETFPRNSLEIMKRVYAKKSFAGKLFDILMVEALKTIQYRMKEDGKKVFHWNKYKGNNIWVPFEILYGKTYKDAGKQIEKSVEIIARELKGKLHYSIVKKGARGKTFLVLNIGEGVLTGGKKVFVKVQEMDYELTNAELMFLRQIQCSFFKNSEQVFNTQTLLEYGRVAWHFINNKKTIERTTLDCLNKLCAKGRLVVKYLSGTNQYFVKDNIAK